MYFVLGIIFLVLFVALCIHVRIVIDDPTKEPWLWVNGRCAMCNDRLFIWQRVGPRVGTVLFITPDNYVIAGRRIGCTGHRQCTGTGITHATVWQNGPN